MAPDAPDPAPVPCPACGGVDFEPGVVDDVQRGLVRWIAGPSRRSWRGRALASSGRSVAVTALRCVRCSRLELYAR